MLTESQLRFFGWIPATYRLENYCNGVAWTQDGETYLCDECDTDYFPDFSISLALTKLLELGFKVEMLTDVWPDDTVVSVVLLSINTGVIDPLYWWGENLIIESPHGLIEALIEAVELVCERMPN